MKTETKHMPTRKDCTCTNPKNFKAIEDCPFHGYANSSILRAESGEVKS